MFYQKKVVGISLSLIMVTLMTGCGASSGTLRDPASPGGSSNVAGPLSDSGSATPDTGSGTPVSNLPPAVRKTFTINGGSGSYQTNVPPTNAELTVRVSASEGGKMSISGSNFTTNYSCAVFDVTLSMQDSAGLWHDTETVTTQKLQVAGQAPCGDGVAHDDISFNGSLSPGHGPMKITLSAPRYDFYCKMYYSCWTSYGSIYNAYGTSCFDLMKPAAYDQVCPTKTVYSSHVVRGALQLRVDHTDFTK